MTYSAGFTTTTRPGCWPPGREKCRTWAKDPTRVISAKPRTAPTHGGRDAERREQCVPKQSVGTRSRAASGWPQSRIVPPPRLRVSSPPRPALVFQGRKDNPVSITVQQLADLVQGTVHGDGSVSIQAARPLGTAQPGDITFVEDDRRAAQPPQTRASAAVAPLSAPL